jgi:hypothetical protein
MTAFRLVARRAPLAACALAALLAAPARAADQAKISAAISAGADYLKKNHAQSASGKDHPMGRMCLVGLALIEAGTPRDDPALQKIVQAVRAGALAETQTYNLALAVLLLDALHDSNDEAAIQFLGVRLYAGMTATGGWSYTCGSPPNPGELAQLQASLQQNALVGQPAKKKKKEPSKPDNGFPRATKKEPKAPAEPETGKLHPVAARYYQAVRQAAAAGRDNNPGDNSNTQFGLIGLWVAGRHGVPADDAFAAIEARFLVTQNKADAGWSYTGGAGIDGRSTAAMTCAGLLGLAVGTGRSRPAPKAAKPVGSPDDPFFNPKKPAEGEKESVAPAARPAVKLAIEAALKSLGRMIQAVRGDANGLRNYTGIGNQYYLLWSIERAAVAYGLDTIGDVDWYAWASDLLISMQQPDGSWPDTSYGSDVNTSFAILVLCKTNFVADLSRKIKGQVKDPGKTELRGGAAAAPPLFAPQQPTGSAGAEKPPAEKPQPTPALPPVIPAAPADPIADALVAAGDDFAAKLAAARDTRGGAQTAGLVHAIPRLDSARKKEAREALAERLTRMTAKTLREMLADPDAELRRAACLACAMKDDKSHIPDLIERINDPSELVVPAARAGLKSLTGKDFGPPPGADETARAKARADWATWYATEGKR